MQKINLRDLYIGLCGAVDHYEPGKGVSFINYAAFWIKQAMIRYVENCGNVVRIPSGMQGQIREYNRFVQRYEQEYYESLTDSAICCFMGVSENTLRNIRQALKVNSVGSLDAPLGAEDGELSALDMVPSGEDMQEDACRKVDFDNMQKSLWQAVDSLPEEQPQVLKMVYQEGKTREQVGDALGYSRSKAEQTERQAIRLLRNTKRCEVGKAYYQEYFAAAPIRHVGLTRFNQTWTSSVELEALPHCNRTEAIRQNQT